MSDDAIPGVYETFVSDGGSDVRCILIEPDDEAIEKALMVQPAGTTTKDGNFIRFNRELDPNVLGSALTRSTELGPCVEAMTANTVGYGWRVISRADLHNVPNLRERIEEEQAKASVALKNMNRKEGLQRVLEKYVMDNEIYGSQFLEVTRSPTGIPVRLAHLPSNIMEIGQKQRRVEKNWPAIVPVIRGGEIVDYRVEEIEPEQVLFNVFWAKRGNQKQFFREFGDPQYKNSTEVIWNYIYRGDYIYGYPRWIGAWLPLEGGYAAEKINYNTFKNNCVPNLAILVSGGKVSKQTINRIKEFINKSIRGGDSYSRVLIIEAETSAEWYQTNSQAKVAIEKLKEEQHDDQLFQNYDLNTRGKIRRSFRMSSIFIGYDEQFTRATADAARRLVDEQVFQIERQRIESIFNDRLFPEMGIVYNLFKLNSPAITDNEAMARIANLLERTGAMTPAIARKIAERIFNEELPFIQTENFDIDRPFTLQLAELSQLGGIDPNQRAQPPEGVAKRSQFEELEKILNAEDKAIMEASVKSAKEDA